MEVGRRIGVHSIFRVLSTKYSVLTEYLQHTTSFPPRLNNSPLTPLLSMRQLGTLPNQTDAERLAAWLVTQRIDAHAEATGDEWAVWVRDEDHLPQAREALVHFQANPKDPRYRGAESEAERLRREEERERKKALGNIVEMRGRWSSGIGGAARR